METLVATLKNRSFFFLWTSEVFSQLAMNMMSFMLTLIAFSLTNSSTAVSGIILCYTLPAIFFAIPAGVYVDRWNKKTVLFVTNFVRAVLLLFIALFAKNLILLYVFSFIVSLITQFFIPAETPMIPLLVKKNLLFAANALFGVALFGSIMLAYALTGPFLILFSPQVGFFILSVMFLLGAFAVLGVRKLSQPKTSISKKQEKLSIVKEIRDTIAFIAKVSTVYHAFSLLTISQILVFIIAVIGPGYAKNILHININQFPILFVIPAVIGIGIGIVLLSTFFKNRNRQKLGTLGVFLTAAVLLAMPFGSQVTSRTFIQAINMYLPHFVQITILHFMVVLACVMGIANAFVFVPSNTLIQEATSEEMRGKVYGALNALISLLAFLPIVLVGSLSDIIGVGNVLFVVGICIALIGLIRLIIT